MGAMLGSRPMTSAERVRRHRALKALREREDDARTQAYVLAGLTGEHAEARQAIAAFLTGLSRNLAEIEAELAALRAEVGARMGRRAAWEASGRAGAVYG